MKLQIPADDSASPISPTAYRLCAMRTAASAPRNRAARSIHIHHAYKVYRLQGSTCRHPARFGIKRQRYKCLLSKMVACSVPGPYGRPRLNEPGQPISRIGSPSHCAATDQLAVEHPPACNAAPLPRACTSCTKSPFALSERYGTISCAEHGELSEWPKEHDWKSCRRQKRLQGSNP